MTSFSNLAMYALTVQPPSATQQAIVGDFAGVGRQQILTASGSRLTLIEVVRSQQAFTEVHSHDVFGIIRALASFRLAGSSKDFIAVTSDSGRYISLEYLKDEGKFVRIHDETYGKSGVRRVIPGQYLASDPKGRAIMIASVEKNKLVYTLNRTTQGEIQISSPLEAHRPQTLVYNICALDVGYDNPIFAVLELDYTDSDADPSGQAYEEVVKELVYYELDLGLNHVVRKWAEPADRSANIMFRVPGGHVGPSGVLVCAEDSISYHRIHMSSAEILRVPIPRRMGAAEDPNRKRTIVAGTLYTLKGGSFFYLLQTEDGDIFKVTFDLEEGNAKIAERLNIKYFDTIPVASSICLLKSGFLYCASESGDRLLYELEHLGDKDDEPVFNSDSFPSDPSEEYSPIYFRPRPLLNLNLVRSIESLNPLMDMQVANPVQDDAPQIYTISGTGARSTFRTSTHALSVIDLVESELPDLAKAVWTIKTTAYDEHDSYIVLSMRRTTLVLRIAEDVEEATDTGFIRETETLGAQQFGEDCIIQIHPKGIRRIESSGALSDWHVPEHRSIVACSTNNRQVAIALSSGEIYYFQVDEDGRSLAKADDEASLDSTITCLAIGDVPEGRAGSSYLAVGCDDSTVRIFSLFANEYTHILKQQSLQAITSSPSALAISIMRDRSSRGYSHYLHVGLNSGVYIRTAMDDYTGELSETRRRFIGTSPIRFAKVTVDGEPAIVILSSKSWLGYSDPRNHTLALTPLNYLSFESAFSFESEEIKGIIGIRQRDLRIFTVDKLSTNLHQDAIPLQYTPRKFASDTERGLFYVIESESHTMAPATRKMLEDQAKDQDSDTDMANAENAETSGTNGKVPNGEPEEQPREEDNADGEASNGISKELSAEQFGYPKATGHWSSCIQVVDPVNEKKVLHTIDLDDNRSATSVILVTFESQKNETFLAVGIAKDMSFSPLSYKTGGVLLYRLLDEGTRLEQHSFTTLDEPPLAMLGFKGRLLIGVGKDLRLYDCGKKALLRKAQATDAATNRITGLRTQGSRIIVADQRDSVTYIVHKPATKPERLLPFAQDNVSRHTTAIDMVDYESVVGGDKFGNIWMLRCPPKVSEVADEGDDGQHLLQEKPYLGGTPNRLDLAMQYFVNDVPVAVQKTGLVAGGEKILVWAGLQGTLGVFIPFQSRREFKMFQELQSRLRDEDKPLLDRDHLAFRSYYIPVKGTIDGDLIERFLILNRDKRERIAGSLDGSWTVEAVEQKIWNMRGVFAF